MISPEKIVDRVLKVAALPEVAIKFGNALDNPFTTNQDLEEIILEDSALSSRVLRVANSPLYAFPSKINTISQAVTIIGQNQLSDIILACSAIQAFSGISDEYINMQDFWRHSLSVGLLCRIFSAQRRDANIERLFVAGLLHDIGRLILLQEKPKEMLEAFEVAGKNQQLLYKMEKETLGFDHALLGGLLLKKWKLPVDLYTIVRYHHHPEKAGNYALDASIVQVSDTISHALIFGNSGEKYVPPINQKQWENLNIDIDGLSTVIDQLEIQLSAAEKYILS